MEWNKHIVESRSFILTAITAFILLFIGFYLNSFLLFFASVLFLVIVMANNYYLKRMGENLYISNEKVRNRFFIDEEGQWELTFYNEGLPIMKAELRVYFDHCVSPKSIEAVEQFSMFEMVVPLSINRNQKKSVQIPFRANKRGIAKIRKMELNIPHFFGFGTTILEYNGLVRQEALVYPKPKPVSNLKMFVSNRPGSSNVAHSLFDDLLAPSGTREYVSTDSFNRIHWKASARKQVLQTKVFDRIAEKGWHISLNVADGYAITGKLEPLLSSVAEMAYFSNKYEIPLSLCINIRTAGSTPFYYIAAGTGSAHLQRVLETLAVIDNRSNIFPYDKMISFFSRHLQSQPYFFHAGIRTDLATSQLKQIENRGVSMLEIMLNEEQAVIVPLQLPVKEVVNQ